MKNFLQNQKQENKKLYDSLGIKGFEQKEVELKKEIEALDKTWNQEISGQKKLQEINLEEASLKAQMTKIKNKLAILAKSKESLISTVLQLKLRDEKVAELHRKEESSGLPEPVKIPKGPSETKTQEDREKVREINALKEKFRQQQQERQQKHFEALDTIWKESKAHFEELLSEIDFVCKEVETRSFFLDADRLIYTYEKAKMV